MPRRRAVLAGVTGLVTGLAGCGYRRGGGDVRWSMEMPGSVDALHTTGRHVVVAVHSWGPSYARRPATVQWLDPATGTVEQTLQRSASNTVVDGETLFSVTDTVVRALRDGRELWAWDAVEPVEDFAVGGETVYVLDSGLTLSAVGIDGTLRWRVRVPETRRRYGWVTASDRGVYRSTRIGDMATVTAFAPDGTERWRHTIADPDQTPRIATVGGTLLRWDGGNLRAVSVSDGRGRWSGNGVVVGRASASERAYVSYRGTLSAVDAETGVTSWTHDGWDTPYDPWGRLRTADGRCYFRLSSRGSNAYRLRSLDDSTGDHRWTVSELVVGHITATEDVVVTAERNTVNGREP